MPFRWTVVAILTLGTLVPMVAGGQECVEPPIGMTAWWPGDSNAADVFGSWGGTLVGNTTYATGKVGRAFSFDGNGDYVQVSPSSAGDFGADPFTVDFWMYSNNVGERAYVIGKSNPNVGGAGWDIRLDAQTIKVYGLDGWVLNIVSDASATASAWHHIALTATTTDVELYIDGVLKGFSARATIPTESDPLRIGDNPNYGDPGFYGLIDELEFFDRALSAAEVQSIYNAGAAGKCRPCAALPSDAVAWWRAEDDATDEIGTNDGTPTGDAAWDDGKVGRAFSLDGTGDYILLPDDDLWDFGTGSFSIVSWFKTSTAGYRNIVRYHNGGGGTGWWGVRIEPAGKLEFLVNTSDGSNPITQQSVGVFTDGEWHFVAAVRDAGAGALRLYVDGASAATPLSDGAVNVVAAAGTVPAIGAGVLEAGGPYEPFAGLVDEVAIFERALTEREIEAMANAGASGVCLSCTDPPPDLVSWWQGEDDATDATGAFDGTAVNGATYAPGLVGQAFSFDGVDDRVDIAVGVGDFGSDPFTVDFWINADDVLTDTYLVGKSHFNNELGWDVQLFAGTIRVVGVNGWALNISSGVAIEVGRWHHIAVAATDSKVTLYIDGIVEGTSGRGTISTTTNPLRIGGATDFLYEDFDGLIDEVELHDRALSHDEVAAIYSAGANGKCALDTEPEPFSFTDLTAVPLNSSETSDAITVSGINVAAAITIDSCTSSSCEYSVNSGPWTSAGGIIDNGDQVEVRLTSAGAYGTTADLILDIGGVTDTFSVTTVHQYTLTISLAGTGSGTVTSSPAGIDCGVDCDEAFTEGTTVTLTATRDAGSRFVGWTGAPDCVDGEVTVSADIGCTATFEPAIFEDGFESGNTSAWSTEAP